METGIQSSFIPHDAGEVKLTPPRIGGSGGFSEFMLLISIVLVVASGALAAGVFVYKQYLTTSTNSKKEQLQRAKDAFDPSLIQQLTRLDDRMHAGSAILSQHIAPTVFLSALSQATLTSVSFKQMSLSNNDQQNINVKLSGIAQSVNSIALQAQVFGKNGVIARPIFSNIGRKPEGVQFDLSFSVNPKALNYQQMLLAANPTPPPPPPSPESVSPFGGTSSQ
jgi:hypothetical protein